MHGITSLLQERSGWQYTARLVATEPSQHRRSQAEKAVHLQARIIEMIKQHAAYGNCRMLEKLTTEDG